MFQKFCVCLALSCLAACGDPLAGLDRISDVELASTDPVANAVPSDAEVAREGFFGTDAARADPVASETAEQAAAPEPKRRGLMGLLRRNPLAADADVNDADQAVALALEDAATSISDESTPVENEEESIETVQIASLAPEAAPKRRGLFGRAAPKGFGGAKSTDVTDVAYGTTLPYGVIARSCEARRKPLGRKIESASAKGYKLYDSDPGSIAPRTYYITGFSDGCPRKLTAANVLLGAPSRYEELHYGPTGKDLVHAETDKAYEKLKQKTCRVRKGKPCGSRIGQMDKTTFFVNSYARFDDTGRWSEALIHDGIVIATAIKTIR